MADQTTDQTNPTTVPTDGQAPTDMNNGGMQPQAPMTPAPEGMDHEAPVAEPTAPMGTPAEAPVMTPGADSAPAAEGEEQHPMDATTPAEAPAMETPAEEHAG